MRRPATRTLATMLLAAVLCAASAGCRSDEKLVEARRNLADCRERLDRAQEENERLQQRIDDQQKRIDTLMALGDKRLDKLYYVDRLDIGRYSTGVDTDDEPGDDAVKVFLQPIDQEGNALKAAGSARIRVYDLAGDGNGALIGERRLSVDEFADDWAGGFMTYHYSTTVPFDRPPTTNEVTVRVEFVEYLTGRTFSAQRVAEVDAAAAE